jgi:penicillin amidase
VQVLFKWLRRSLIFVLLVGVVALAGAYVWLRGSLPQLDGQLAVDGVQGQVDLHRDAQGLLALEGRSRADIAFGLGFAHAQERFFQMDLQRRSAAGELSELFGPLALASDRDTRVHRFRFRAQRNLALATPGVRRLLEAYAAGVNAGLTHLFRAPFEYAVLRAEPVPWRPEDSYLVLLAMTLVLQDEQARFERGMGLMHDVLPPDLFAFFTQQGGRWDAPLHGESFEELPVPGTGFDALPALDGDLTQTRFTNGDLFPGSNNWALDGRFTTHGGALVADDMHLGLRAPNIWYRAAWTDPRNGRTVSGLTLPGVPFLVAGSNGRVAWGFTNTQGDWTDVIQLDVSEDGKAYRVPGGWAPFTRHEELIAVKGADDEIVRIRETRWGPVIGKDHRGRELALRWTAHDPEGANFRVTGLELADNVFDPVAGAHEFGIPHQNLVIGDQDGNIAWTIAGPVPRRVGHDGRLPRPWHEEGRGWDGYHDGASHPKIVNPPDGRLWTANARVVSGERLQKMGSHGSALGARQQQIRDRLLALETADEQAMLAIQLDDEARFLARWRERLLALLTPAVTGGAPELEEARAHIEAWAGRADAEDVGYRLVRNFRLETLSRIAAPLESHLQRHDESFRIRWVNRQFEYPAWSLLEARPAGLLNPNFERWEDLELDALNAVIDPLYEDGTLANDAWGEQNRLAVEHWLAGAVPFLGRWLAMPSQPMHGDGHMPRVQHPSSGASERFAVSPGREGDAYLHMPAGQSGHPLSPFFRAGHDDWVEGRPSNWLPGTPRHLLELVPRGDG